MTDFREWVVRSNTYGNDIRSLARSILSSLILKSTSNSTYTIKFMHTRTKTSDWMFLNHSAELFPFWYRVKLHLPTAVAEMAYWQTI